MVPLVRAILANVPSAKIVNRNGDVLRITATAKQNAVIKELLAQLRRRQSIGIAIRCRLVDCEVAATRI